MRLDKFNVVKYQIYDCIIYELMQRYGVTELVTMNTKNFKGFPNISLIIPYRKVNEQ